MDSSLLRPLEPTPDVIVCEFTVDATIPHFVPHEHVVQRTVSLVSPCGEETGESFKVFPHECFLIDFLSRPL